MHDTQQCLDCWGHILLKCSVWSTKSDENRRAWESKTNQKIRLATEKVKLKRGIGLQIEERKEIWHPNKRAPFRP